jgi:drug/metabolite transporter (DMT)-like permease
METHSDRRKAVLFLFIAAILWSTSGLFVKIMDWQPAAILAGRSIFSSILFLVYLRRIPLKWTRWQIMAAAAYVLTQFLYITAMKMTTAANAIFLQYTAPVYIVILGYWFLREKPARADWVSMLLIFSGLFLFFGDSLNLNGLYGNLLAALSGVTLALLTVSMRAQKDGNPAESILLANLFTATFGFAFVWQEPWTITNWGILIYLGIFQIGLAFLLYSIAIKHVPALEATLIGTLEPILNPLWVFLFIAEMPGKMALLGALIVLAGVVISAITSARVSQPVTE